MNNKIKVVKALFNKDFQKELNEAIENKIEELENNDPHEYGGKWDNNPYGVEPQLASGSGCWEFPDWGEDKAYEEAKEYVINGFFEGYYNLPEAVEEFLEHYDNKDREWLEAILNSIL